MGTLKVKKPKTKKLKEYNVSYALSNDDMGTMDELKTRHKIQDVLINKGYKFLGGGCGFGGADIQFATNEDPATFLTETLGEFGIYHFDIAHTGYVRLK